MITQADDFNPQKEIAKIRSNFEQPDKFAQIFSKAAKKTKAIDEVIKYNIRDVMIRDYEMMNFLKKILREVEKEDWKNAIKKIGSIGSAVLLMAIGAILQALSRRYL